MQKFVRVTRGHVAHSFVDGRLWNVPLFRFGVMSRMWDGDAMGSGQQWTNEEWECRNLG